jgi:hypothetical protein
MLIQQSILDSESGRWSAALQIFLVDDDGDLFGEVGHPC